jgi:hypothetical protein
MDTSANNLNIEVTSEQKLHWQIDDTRIYNYARSAAQVRGTTTKETNCSLENGRVPKGSIFDASGNGNTGTITIGALAPKLPSALAPSGTAWYRLSPANLILV